MHLPQLDCDPSGLESSISSTKYGRTTVLQVIPFENHLSVPIVFFYFKKSMCQSFYPESVAVSYCALQQTLSMVTKSPTRLRTFKLRTHPLRPGSTLVATLNNLHVAKLLRNSSRSRSVVCWTEVEEYGQEELSRRGRSYEMVLHMLCTPWQPHEAL